MCYKDNAERGYRVSGVDDNFCFVVFRLVMKNLLKRLILEYKPKVSL